MKIGVGSTNQVKIDAVTNAVAMYPEIFPEAEVVAIDVSVETFGHPKGIEEITKGAVERAQKSYVGNSYGFGLESGLVTVPHSKSGFLEIQICAIYDGNTIHIGSAPGFEWPPRVAKLIATGKADGSQAFKMAGFTENEKQGAVKGGVIGMLTKGRMPREAQSLHSIVMAMIQLENRDMYE